MALGNRDRSARGSKKLQHPPEMGQAKQDRQAGGRGHGQRSEPQREWILKERELGLPGRTRRRPSQLHCACGVGAQVCVGTDTCVGFAGGSAVKDQPARAGDVREAGSIPGSGRSPEEGNGSPLQDSCLENPMDGGAWWDTVHGVAKSRTRLSVHRCVCRCV